MSAGNWSKIFIRDLALDLHIGVNPDEYGRRQRVIVSVEATIDAPGGFADDDLVSTVSYDPLVRAIQDIENAPHIHLIETVAERITALAMTDKRVQSVVTEVQKLGVYDATSQVGVILRRCR